MNDNDSGYKDYVRMYFKGGQSGQSGQSSESWFTLGVQSSCQQSELFLIIANLNINVIANLNIKQHEKHYSCCVDKKIEKGGKIGDEIEQKEIMSSNNSCSSISLKMTTC